MLHVGNIEKYRYENQNSSDIIQETREEEYSEGQEEYSYVNPSSTGF